MADDFQIPEELNEFESSLGALRPRSTRVDRDRLMFAAGQSSGDKAGRRLWRAWVVPLLTAVAGWWLGAWVAAPLEAPRLAKAPGEIDLRRQPVDSNDGTSGKVSRRDNLEPVREAPTFSADELASLTADSYLQLRRLTLEDIQNLQFSEWNAGPGDGHSDESESSPCRDSGAGSTERIDDSRQHGPVLRPRSFFGENL